MKQIIEPKQGVLDLQELVNNLDNRGILVLQVMLGQRAIQLLETKEKPKVKSSLLLPNQPSVSI